VFTNQSRSKLEREYEILDTGLFDDNKYFDVFTEYAKKDAEDILIKVTVHNRGDNEAFIALLPTLWFRNLWSFGLSKDKPVISLRKDTGAYNEVVLKDSSLGMYHFYFEKPVRTLFTENETNTERLYGQPNSMPFTKDAFHYAVTGNNYGWLETKTEGTKFSPHYEFTIGGQQSITIKLRLRKAGLQQDPFGEEL
jgi:hypothetical protein